MAAEIKKEFGVSPQLSIGPAGHFFVVINGETLYSLQDNGRFPRRGEVTSLIKAMKK